MEHQTMLTFVLLCLASLSGVLASRCFESRPLHRTAANRVMAGTTVSAHPDEADSLVLPDGTPLYVKVAKAFSSENTKVGDVVDFAVAFEVRADGVVVIPQRTSLAGRVVSVSSARRTRNGQVQIVYDALTLPTGETATVRPILKPPHPGAKAAQAAVNATGTAVGVFITAGNSLLALSFRKGDEQVVPAGTLAVVYLNGPLQVSRKAAITLQPAPASGYALVHISADIRVRRNDLSLPKLFCGERLLGDSYGELQLELPPGTYWFTTDNQKDRPARIEALASREYRIWKNRRGLVGKELRARKGRTYSEHYGDRLLDEDLTKLTPEEYRSLTVEPAGRWRTDQR
jgi:hypothetical protein